MNILKIVGEFGKDILKLVPKERVKEVDDLIVKVAKETIDNAATKLSEKVNPFIEDSYEDVTREEDQPS